MAVLRKDVLQVEEYWQTRLEDLRLRCRAERTSEAKTEYLCTLRLFAALIMRD